MVKDVFPREDRTCPTHVGWSFDLGTGRESVPVAVILVICIHPDRPSTRAHGTPFLSFLASLAVVEQGSKKSRGSARLAALASQGDVWPK